MFTSAAMRWHKVFEGLWFVPTLLIVALGGAAFALTSIDRAAAQPSDPGAAGS